MNIIEAIKSKRPFKRLGWSEFIEIAGIGNACWINSGDNISLKENDLIAEDWEIAETKTLVSKSQLEKAYEYAFGNVLEQWPADKAKVQVMAQFLGLE